MAERLKMKARPKRGIKHEPLDKRVFRFLLTNEAGKCSLSGIRQRFTKFKNEQEVIRWVQDLMKTTNRKLLHVFENEIRVYLGGVENCKKYGRGWKCSDKCSDFHLCLYHLKGFCKNKDQCTRSHSIIDEHNKNVLRDNHMHDLGERLAFKALRYICRWNKSKKKPKQSDRADDTDDTLSVASDLESVVSWLDNDDIFSLDGDTEEEEEDGPDEVDVFRTILRKYKGQCSLNTLIVENPELGSEHEMTQLFNDIRERADDDEWFEFDGIEVFLKLPFEICPDYVPRTCSNDRCSELHLCKFGVLGLCKYGSKCKFFHSLHSGPNEEIIRLVLEDGLTEDDILSFLKIQFQKEKDDDSDTDSVKSHLSTVASADKTDIKSELVRYIMKEHNGKCRYADLTRGKRFGLSNKNEVKKYINLGEGKDRLAIITREKGAGDLIYVKLGNARACRDYRIGLTCDSSCCEGFHLCPKAVRGVCDLGAKRCNLYHNLHNVHNRNLVKKLQLDDLSNADILLYLKLQDEEKLDDLAVKAASMTAEAVGWKPMETVPSLDVLEFLLKQKDGICSLKKFASELGFQSEEAAEEWVVEPSYNSVCKLYKPGHQLHDPVVMTSVPHLQLCTSYQIDSCSGCDRIHVCRDLIAGNCAQDACKYIHWVAHSKNNSALSKAGLESWNNNQLLLATKFSNPHLCSEYNSNSGCNNPGCTKMHLCSMFTKQRCSGKCSYSHNLLEAPKKGLESIYGRQIFSIFNLIPCPSQDSSQVKPTEKLQARKPAKINKGSKAQPQPTPLVPSQVMPLLPNLMNMDNTQLNQKRQMDVLDCLLSIGGSTTLTYLNSQLRHEFRSTTDLLTWLLGPVGNKVCAVYHRPTPDQTLVILQVHRFQLCFSYSTKEGCKKESCTYFHLCKNFVTSRCANAEKCNLGHDVTTGHNLNVVVSSGVHFATYESILYCIRMSLPKICQYHNTPVGCLDVRCGDFHICLNYIQKKCPYSSCVNGHDLKSDHNGGLLTALGHQEKALFKSLQLLYEEETKALVNAPRKIQEKSRRISKMNVLRFLLRNDEEVLVEEIARQDEFKNYTVLDMLNYFKSHDGKDICRVFPGKTNEKHVISLSVKKLSLCFGYCGSRGCEKRNCEFLHLCREFVVESCHRRNCKYSHEVRDETNRRVIQKNGIGSLADDEVLKVIRRSTPQVCMEHNSTKGCHKSICMKFHICADQIRKKCARSKDCPKGHGMASQHNQQLLDMYEKPENVMYMMLVVSSATKEIESVPTPPANTRKAKLEVICVELILPQLLIKYEGFCSMKKFIETFPEHMSLETTEACDLLLGVRQYMCSHVSENQGRFRSMVLCRIEDLGICYGYSGKTGCKRNRCSQLHLCRAHAAGYCSKGVDCASSHNIEERHNASILAKAELPESIPKQQIVTLVRNSFPRVCGEHNTKAGCQKEDCFKLHICRMHIKQACKRSAEECSYGHSLETSQNKAVLNLFKLSTEESSGKILVADSKPPAKVVVGTAKVNPSLVRVQYSQQRSPFDMTFPKAQTDKNLADSTSLRLPLSSQHTSVQLQSTASTTTATVSSGSPFLHTAPSSATPRSDEFTPQRHDLLLDWPQAPSIPICSGYLAGTCNTVCGKHHHRMPYVWCYRENGKWKPFDEEMSRNIEKEYCKEEKEVFRAEFKGENMMVEFDTDLNQDDRHIRVFQAIFAPLTEVHNFENRVWRLSTESYMASETLENQFGTVWKWYWKDNKGWKSFGTNDEFPQQDVIEAKYLSKKTNEILFESGENTYKMHMVKKCQVNTYYGTTRPIRRRPVFVADTRTKPSIPTRRYSAADLPRDWLPMNTKSRGYDLIPLPNTDSSYKNVLNRFQKTMLSHTYEILEIFKVQNLLMWETFTRHKEDLVRFDGSTPDQRQLFHGTNDEETVKGICYQNFDPRMHGKNATVYGRGAYFARDASYSDRYTSQSGKRYMFLADVLVGQYTMGDSSMVRPPKKQGQSRQHDLYDSTVDNVNNPSIFVVYACEKCYPSYLILYKEKGDRVAWKNYYEGTTPTHHSFDGFDFGASFNPPRRPPPPTPHTSFHSSSAGTWHHSAGGSSSSSSSSSKQKSTCVVQ